MPRFNLPRPRPTVAPRPTSTIAPKRPDPLPTKTPEVAKPPKTTIAPKRPDPPIVKPPKTTIAPKRPDPLPTKPPAVVAPPLTTWMRPPQGTATDEGLMPGDPGYVDPHAGVMAEWEDIDKGSTGGFRPDGTVILHSDPDSAHSLNNNANSSASTDTENSSASTDTENALGQSLLTSSKSGVSRSRSVGGGYGKQRVAEQSRKQMNHTFGRSRSLLTT